MTLADHKIHYFQSEMHDVNQICVLSCNETIHLVMLFDVYFPHLYRTILWMCVFSTNKNALLSNFFFILRTRRSSNTGQSFSILSIISSVLGTNVHWYQVLYFTKKIWIPVPTKIKGALCVWEKVHKIRNRNKYN